MYKNLLFIFTCILFIQGCNEESKAILPSPHNIRCVGQVECLANETLGNVKDDKLLFNVYNITAEFFSEYPTSFFILHEPTAFDANAFASRKNGNNYIYFGEQMFYLLKADNEDDYYVNILGILAHEYAHIVQFNLDVDRKKIDINRNQRQVINIGESIILSELEADAFSGYFMYHTLMRREAIVEFIDMMASLGDYAFESKQHHGTPQQRQAAAELGILAAKDLDENNITLSFKELRYKFLGDIISTILIDSDF